MNSGASNPTFPDSNLPFVDLPSESRLVTALQHEDMVEVNDHITSTGSLDIYCCELPNAGSYSDSGLANLNRNLADELVRRHAKEATDSKKFETTVKPYSPKLVTAAARILAVEVNVFTNSGGHDTRRLGKTLRQVLDCLPLNERTTKVVVSRAVYNDEGNSFENRHITVTLFVNVRTGRAVVFYMVEGSK